MAKKTQPKQSHILDDTIVNALIDLFENFQQKKLVTKPPPHISLPSSNPHKLHIPSPKASTYEPIPSPTITDIRRNIFQRYQYNVPTKHYAVHHLAATELFGKMMHMYDNQGCKALLDSLRRGASSDV